MGRATARALMRAATLARHSRKASRSLHLSALAQQRLLAMSAVGLSKLDAPQRPFMSWFSTAAEVESAADDLFEDTYNVSQTLVGSDACAAVGIDVLGVTGPTTVFKNLTYPELFAHEQANAEGAVAKAEYGDTFTVDTGKFTGRSPADKWTVKNEGSESDANLWWGPVNKPMQPAVFDELYVKAVKYFNTLEKVTPSHPFARFAFRSRDSRFPLVRHHQMFFVFCSVAQVYVADVFCGANPATQVKVRFLHEMAWQQHFVTNMFIRPTPETLEGFTPDFTAINACALTNENWQEHGLNSEVAVAFNIEKATAVIFGTWYGGENKKVIRRIPLKPSPSRAPARRRRRSLSVSQRGRDFGTSVDPSS